MLSIYIFPDKGSIILYIAFIKELFPLPLLPTIPIFSLGEKILNKNISDNLSLGEKQLICFSRAILTKKKIVIFDEATANLDKDSEEIINKVIKDEFKDCTIFIVAHKLINIKDCDKILVMDKGKIAEFDSPKKLYNDNKSIFRQLCIHDNLVL